MTALPPEASEHAPPRQALGLLAALAAFAIIAGLLTYSAIDAVSEGHRPAGATGTAATQTTPPDLVTLKAGGSAGAIDTAAPALLTLVRCDGEAVLATIAAGTTLHMYMLELLLETRSLSPADARASGSICVRAGVERVSHNVCLLWQMC